MQEIGTLGCLVGAHRLKLHPGINTLLFLSYKVKKVTPFTTHGKDLLLLTHLGLFFQLLPFVLFLSLLLHCEISSLPLFFFHFFNIFCPSWPWCHSVFCARGAMMELNTDYGSYLLYPCQDSCQEQWMKMKSAWIKIMGDTIQVKRYHRNIFSFGWVCCGIKFEAPTRLIFSYPESP